MSVDWNGYERYVPPVQGLLHELPRKQAQMAFEHLMAAKPGRIECLRRLLDANGVTLATDDSAVQQLNDWFRTNVEVSAEDPARLRSIWYAVVNDVALFLGDVMIERFPGLRWEMFTAARKDVSYQRHVLVGFSKAPNPRFNVDVDRLIATYAYRATGGGRVVSNHFLTLIRAAGEKS